MIFLFIEENFKDCIIPEFDLERIGRIIETMEEGTLPVGILNLNKVREVATAKPSIEFELKLKFHHLNELEAETKAFQPPIAWIYAFDKEKQHKFHHAVVITGVEGGVVYYNDPIFGKKEETIDNFLTKWDDEDRILVTVRIGKKKERKLEEFITAFNKDKHQVSMKEGSKDGNES